jgi:hypothetical protein
MLIILLREQKLSSTELLQAQQLSVKYTVKICLNVSCHSPLLLVVRTNTVTFTLSLNCIEWLSRYFLFIFALQKRIIRIMVGANHRTSCRRLFKKLEILTVPSQYIYSLMSFSSGIRKNFILTRQCITVIQ